MQRDIIMDSSQSMSTDFEMVIGESDVGNTEKSKGACVQVSKRRSKYESRMVTESGLITLGKQLAQVESDKEKREAKYKYLTASVEELDGFNGSQFMSDFLNCTDKNITLGKIQSLVGYVSLFKELYQYHIEDIKCMDKTISLLKDENADMYEMIDNYIIELDESESNVKKMEGTVKLYKNTIKQKETSIYNVHCENTENMKKIVQLEIMGDNYKRRISQQATQIRVQKEAIEILNDKINHTYRIHSILFVSVVITVAGWYIGVI